MKNLDEIPSIKVNPGNVFIIKAEGPTGSGKTSALHIIRRALDQNKGYRVWSYEPERHMLLVHYHRNNAISEMG